MKNTFINAACIAFCAATVALAGEYVPRPIAKILESARHVIVGEVISVEIIDGGYDTRVITIRIDSVIKGNIDQKKVVLKINYHSKSNFHREYKEKECGVWFIAELAKDNEIVLTDAIFGFAQFGAAGGDIYKAVSAEDAKLQRGIDEYFKFNGIKPAPLTVGMTVEEFITVLGEPTGKYPPENLLGWSHNPQGLHVAPNIGAFVKDGKVVKIEVGRGY